MSDEETTATTKTKFIPVKRIHLFLIPLILSVPSLHSVGHAAEPVTNSVGMKLVRIETGTFTMGQDGPPMEDYLRQKRFGEMHKDIDRIDFDEKPAHRVTITQPFQIGVTEVTVAQYRQFDPEFKKNDPKSKPADDDAVTGVTRDKAVALPASNRALEIMVWMDLAVVPAE